jgi:DnaJ-class molecular chaperone
MSRSRERAKRKKRLEFENNRRLMFAQMNYRAFVYPTTVPCAGCFGQGIVRHFGPVGVRDFVNGLQNVSECPVCGGTGKVVMR